MPRSWLRRVRHVNTVRLRFGAETHKRIPMAAIRPARRKMPA